MKIALLHSTNPSRKIALNKDLNGGLGTADAYGKSLGGRLLTFLKRKYISLPVISIAHIQAVLKRQGHQVEYFEDRLPVAASDVALIYGSMVDHSNENKVLREYKRRFPSDRVGVFGPFPARFPDRFPEGHFVIGGEAEAFFVDGQAERLLSENGLIDDHAALDLDDLPPPDYSGFPIHKYSYAPMLPRKPYVPLLASKGCPYSCRFYCTYGEYQGAKIRQRSAEHVYRDMRHLAATLGVRSVQFRDPLFGMSRMFVLDLCQRLISDPLDIEWGMETRADLLTPELLDRMRAAGLRSVNLGIETGDAAIAKANKRKLVADDHQTLIVRHAEKIGVRINAFFIFALEGDTMDTMTSTADFALRLNPTAARFSVSTPYPGTGFYEQLSREGRLTGEDWEGHTQFSLVHKHATLTAAQVERALVRAYLRFYLRPSYVARTAWGVWRGNSRLFADNRRRRPALADANLDLPIGPPAAPTPAQSAGLPRLDAYLRRLASQMQDVEAAVESGDLDRLKHAVIEFNVRGVAEPVADAPGELAAVHAATARLRDRIRTLLDGAAHEEAGERLAAMREDVSDLTREVRTMIRDDETFARRPVQLTVSAGAPVGRSTRADIDTDPSAGPRQDQR